MKNLSEVFSELRRQSRQQYALITGCLFFSVLLITAYCLMMRSPTVLNVLPVGGDSRKQVMMIFVLSVIGCGAFTLYASGLFFREKSREIGVFLALGASKKAVGQQLRLELGVISLTACVLGLALGAPLAWLVWGVFRLTLVDTAEMALFFDLRAYSIALVFSVLVILALFVMLSRSLRRTNIIDIVSEAHRSEPIRSVPHWYGVVGIVLLAVGSLLGYLTPTFCVLVLHWYAPGWLTGITFLPALLGLYMLLLHTVVNGWRRGQSRYKHIVTTSMMQFQGRQTVRNMLVVTVLVAGAYFSAFYVPLLATSAQMGFADRTEDYSFFYRADQKMLSQAEIEQLAKEESVRVVDYVCQPVVVLGVDGQEHIESKSKLGTTYSIKYCELLRSDRFISESAWNTLTGESVDLSPGTTTTVFDKTGNSQGFTSNDVTLVTNPITGETLNVTPVEPVLKNDLLFRYRVLDDGDYAAIIAGLTDQWREKQVFFKAENDSYAFAKRLFHRIVDCSGSEVELCDGYDPIIRQRRLERGEPYLLDPENAEENHVTVISYDQCDSSAFRMNWMYMPKFRVLDQADFSTNTAVFLLLFVFVSILCFTAVAVILFTRSLTVALTNAWVYDDLRHLGAPNSYLRDTVRGQISRVFLAPIITGTLLILAFVSMILLFNSGFDISVYELAGLRNCLIVVAVISSALYGFYRLTLRTICRKLKI